MDRQIQELHYFAFIEHSLYLQLFIDDFTHLSSNSCCIKLQLHQQQQNLYNCRQPYLRVQFGFIRFIKQIYLRINDLRDNSFWK